MDVERRIYLEHIDPAEPVQTLVADAPIYHRFDHLLRGGERPAVSDPPPGDYFAMVSKPKPRPLAEVYGWSLADPLPRILIPLSIEDPDVPLDLQAAFNLVYDRAGYDYAINYKQPVIPPLSETEHPMITQVVESMKFV